MNTRYIDTETLMKAIDRFAVKAMRERNIREPFNTIVTPADLQQILKEAEQINDEEDREEFERFIRENAKHSDIHKISKALKRMMKR